MKASELLKDPAKWGKRCFAQDADGNSVGVRSEKACQFCILGAVAHCHGDWRQHFDAIQNSIFKIVGFDVGSSVSRWNDHQATHGQVIQVLEDAGL